MPVLKLFKNGTSQAIRIPKKYRFEGERVIVKKYGNGLIVLPEESGWKTIRSAAEKFSQDFMEGIEDLPPDHAVCFK